jgi:hypothetical protein
MSEYLVRMSVDGGPYANQIMDERTTRTTIGRAWDASNVSDTPVDVKIYALLDDPSLAPVKLHQVRTAPHQYTWRSDSGWAYFTIEWYAPQNV